MNLFAQLAQSIRTAGRSSAATAVAFALAQFTAGTAIAVTPAVALASTSSDFSPSLCGPENFGKFITFLVQHERMQERFLAPSVRISTIGDPTVAGDESDEEVPSKRVPRPVISQAVYAKGGFEILPQPARNIGTLQQRGPDNGTFVQYHFRLQGCWLLFRIDDRST